MVSFCGNRATPYWDLQKGVLPAGNICNHEALKKRTGKQPCLPDSPARSAEAGLAAAGTSRLPRGRWHQWQNSSKTRYRHTIHILALLLSPPPVFPPQTKLMFPYLPCPSLPFPGFPMRSPHILRFPSPKPPVKISQHQPFLLNLRVQKTSHKKYTHGKFYSL